MWSCSCLLAPPGSLLLSDNCWPHHPIRKVRGNKFMGVCFLTTDQIAALAIFLRLYCFCPCQLRLWHFWGSFTAHVFNFSLSLAFSCGCARVCSVPSFSPTVVRFKLARRESKLTKPALLIHQVSTWHFALAQLDCSFVKQLASGTFVVAGSIQHRSNAQPTCLSALLPPRSCIQVV